jgi:hypothetical protein
VPNQQQIQLGGGGRGTREAAALYTTPKKQPYHDQRAPISYMYAKEVEIILEKRQQRLIAFRNVSSRLFYGGNFWRAGN